MTRVDSMLRRAYAVVNPGIPNLFALRAWLTIVAPGMLICRAAIVLAFIVAPWFTRIIQVADMARLVAAILLLAQVLSTFSLLRRPGRWRLYVFVGVLAIELLLSGVVLGAEHQLRGVGLPIAMVALAMSFEAVGWVSVGVGVVLIGMGVAAAVWSGINAPLLWPDTLMFGTMLSVETSFGGIPAVAASVVSFPTTLHVETSYGGVSGHGWTTGLLLPPVALAFAALWLGALVNVVRVRLAFTEPSSGGSTGQRGATGVWVALLVLVSASTAAAQCDPSGRAAFVKGLEVLSHGDVPVATRIFFQLAESQPACPEVRNNLAVLFVEQDRLDDAVTQLQWALQLNPYYERARVNLARVEALIKERRGHSEHIVPTPVPQPSPSAIHSPEESPGTPPTDVTPGETQLVEGTPTETPAAEVTPTQVKPEESIRVPSPAPSSTASERRPGAAVCVIEPAQNRICVYELSQAATAPQECYAITLAQVRWWPRSLVASEVTAQQIRLRDENGEARLEIVPEDTKVNGDALRLRKADWQALAAKVVPWRTAWLVAN